MTLDRVMVDLVQRITEYLSFGGLLNPEMADHEKVRNLLIDCRDALVAPQEQAPVAECRCEFDAWHENRYTKVLLKSIEEDYVPRSSARKSADEGQAVAVSDEAKRLAKEAHRLLSRACGEWSNLMAHEGFTEEKADKAATAEKEAHAAIDALAALYAGAEPEPQCQGEPGECAYNGACMYQCGRSSLPGAEPVARQPPKDLTEEQWAPIRLAVNEYAMAFTDASMHQSASWADIAHASALSALQEVRRAIEKAIGITATPAPRDET